MTDDIHTCYDQCPRPLCVMGRENRVLKKDRERLEWLSLAEVFPMKTKEGWCLSGDGATCWTKTYDSFRDAIDEAIRADW